jgi:hypothetical protein
MAASRGARHSRPAAAVRTEDGNSRSFSMIAANGNGFTWSKRHATRVCPHAGSLDEHRLLLD